ncbi:MAG: cupin domain-containing protein [Paracoccaceae bacterium]
MDEARRLIGALALTPHPEGGWYRQTWAARAEPGERPAGTAILFLLRAGERSHWHRVDADEIWHFHAGGPLRLSVSQNAEGRARDLVLGPGVLTGEMPQIVVPAAHWQSAVPFGAWTLASCTVSPGFRFEGFELAPPGFDIPR